MMFKKNLLPFYSFIIAAVVLGAALFASLSNSNSRMVGRNVSSSVVEKYLDDIRPTLFYTFSTWCTSCKKNYPILEMKEMRKRFRVIGIPVNDSRDRVDYFLEHNPMVFDKVVAEDYKYFQMALGFQGIPETFIIAPNKRVVYNHLGQLNVKEILNVKD